MTARQFEKTVRMVLESYQNYNITDCKVWKENNQIYFTLKLGPDRFRAESWAVSAVFDKSGKLLKSSYGSRRDYMFARILMKRIEEACFLIKSYKKIMKRIEEACAGKEKRQT